MADASFNDALDTFNALRRSIGGEVIDAADLSAHPNDMEAYFTATVRGDSEGADLTQIFRIDLKSGDLSCTARGPSGQRLPKVAPNGTCLAFVEESSASGTDDIRVLDLETGQLEERISIPGRIEELHWSPNSDRILVLVAGREAQRASTQGSGKGSGPDESRENWEPEIEPRPAENWRRVWIYDTRARMIACATPPDYNIWSAAWCGDDAYTAIVTPAPEEGAWYDARLGYFPLADGEPRSLYVPTEQLGAHAANASGSMVAVVEAAASDRGLVAGEVRLMASDGGEVVRPAIDFDASCLEWCSETELLVAGHKEQSSVVAIYNIRLETCRIVWQSDVLTTDGPFMAVAARRSPGDCLLVAEGFFHPPEIAAIEGGAFRTLRPLLDPPVPKAGAEPLNWLAPDGLAIQGWLLRPEATRPCPTIVVLHGGPISHWRPKWLGRTNLHLLMLLDRGYAILLPNPRGSAGWGHDFAARVRGDMGGGDTDDILAGIDHIIAMGIADRDRLGVMGKSYGGFMTYWLTGHDKRFRAAVAICPIANFTTFRLTSNIPEFVARFIPKATDDHALLEASPITYASNVQAETLSICGQQDLCTPPMEALLFHRALLRSGRQAQLIQYPRCGHGFVRFPDKIDYSARIAGWFIERI